MKQILVLGALFLIINSCNDNGEDKAYQNKPDSLSQTEKFNEGEKGIDVGILDLDIIFSKIPYARNDKTGLDKYNVTSFFSEIRQFEEELGIQFGINYYEISSGESKFITQASLASEKMTADGSYLLIPNAPFIYNKLSSEIGKSRNRATTIIFDETTESVYIFISLKDYKGAVKVSRP